jgi:cytochrome c-type biogenesis protein CcmH
MEPGAVAWGWPVAALAAGLLLGAILVWRMVRGPVPARAPESVPLELRDLDGRLDVLVLQLRELQDVGAKRSPEQLARERYALELQAAQALREREERAASLAPARKGKTAAAPTAPPSEAGPPGLLASRPALRGFLWGTATAAAVGLLVFYVVSAARPREEGGGVTGNLPSGARAQASPAADAGDDAGADAEAEAEVRAALEKNPDDLEARLDLAQLHLRRRDLMAVWNETQYVLAKQPGHPRGLSYQALVRLAMGQPDVARKMLKQALAQDPDLFEGYLHLALVETRAGRDKEAQAAIDEASRRFPERADILARVLPEIRASGTQEARAAEVGDAHAAIPPPVAAAEGQPSGRAGGDAAAGGLAGVIELPPSLASRVTAGAIVFITVRESGTTGGPPAAVKRLPAASFPLPFVIGAGDSMMGQPLPARARVEARVDSDGDPLTRAATDPSARLDDVAVGSSGLRLVLR